MLVVAGSVKGSPGVTTTLAALASTWPDDRGLLLVEADPSGGDLGVRFDLVDEPSLVSLAAAGRRQLDAGTLLFHCQALPLAPRANPAERLVLVTPPGPERTTAALAALRTRLGPVLRQLPDHDVLVDCGRLDPGSLALDLVPAADAVLVACRPAVTDVHHLVARLPGLGASPELVVVGDRPYPAEAVAGVVQAPLAAALPDDPRAAAALAGASVDAARALRRSALLRAARDLAEQLVARFATPVVTGAEGAA